MKPITYIALLLLLTTLTFSVAKAQQGGPSTDITGAVVNDQDGPADYATVSLIRAKDSSVVKGALTNEHGHYKMERVKAGHYIVKATMVGYDKAYSQPFNIDQTSQNITVPAIKIKKTSRSLKDVTVTAAKPLIERKADRTVMNVENSVLATGNSAMDILEKAPGVTVDKDDNISLKGKQGVTVMIDGKLTYLSSAQLATLLRSTDGTTIQSIEIITNPSAKYDASGNSGIINIKLKKNRQSGTNGNISLSAGLANSYRDNTSFALNHKQGIVNIFSTFSRGDNPRAHTLNIARTVDSANVPTYFQQYTSLPSQNHYNNYRVGADFDLSKKNTAGFVVSGYFNSEKDNNNSVNYIGRQPEVYNSSLNTTSQINQSYRNFAFNLNDKYQIDTAGQELAVDLDYSKFNNNSRAYYNTYFYNANGGPSGEAPLLLRNQTPSVIEIHTGKADYTLPFNKTFKLETGAKFSDVKTDNNLEAQINSNGTFINDTTRSNRFIYDEKIDAGYVNLNKTFKKTSVQAGLRAEYTTSKGNLVTTNYVVSRHYLDFFPSVFVNQTINDKNEIGINYSRRIDRPGYGDLNPFVYYLDQYTYQKGNPFLKPQYTNSFELNYTYNKSINVSFSYSRTTDVISELLLTDTVKKATFDTRTNLRIQNYYGININTPYNFTKWWSGNINLNGFYLGFKSPRLQSGNLSNTDLNNGKPAFQVRDNNTFLLGKLLKLEITGDYQSSLIYSYFFVKPRYSIDAGLNHSFWDKKANIKFAVDDIFNTRRNDVTSTSQGNYIDIHQKNDSRYARITLTYNFGNTKIKVRQHETGAEQESNRVKSGN